MLSRLTWVMARLVRRPGGYRFRCPVCHISLPRGWDKTGQVTGKPRATRHDLGDDQPCIWLVRMDESELRESVRPEWRPGRGR